MSIDVDAKLLLCEWHRELESLKFKIQGCSDSGDGVNIHIHQAEHDRLHRCVDSLEVLVYEYVAKLKNNEQETKGNALDKS